MGHMKRKSTQITLIAFAITAVLALGACGPKKKETLPEAGPAETGAAESQVIEEQPVMTPSQREAEEQEGARREYVAEPMLEDVHFDFDKSDLRPDAREILNKNAEWIRNNPGVKIQIEGHCDERGTEEYNLALGERRANSVKNYLVSLGIEADRLYTISYGEELPLDPGHNEEAWAKNRRAHFLVTK